MVTEIDRHIKDTEHRLNERLVHVPARIIIEDFEPKGSKNEKVTKIGNDIWNSLSFGKIWRSQKSLHEEICFEKATKGFGFFLIKGEVTFDIGVCEDMEGTDWYYRIIEDKRESFKVTGASVDIKLRAFRHLSQLLPIINEQANQIAFYHRQAPASGNKFNRMSLDMTEAFSPAELAEIDRNYACILPKR